MNRYIIGTYNWVEEKHIHTLPARISCGLNQKWIISLKETACLLKQMPLLFKDKQCLKPLYKITNWVLPEKKKKVIATGHFCNLAAVPFLLIWWLSSHFHFFKENLEVMSSCASQHLMKLHVSAPSSGALCYVTVAQWSSMLACWIVGCYTRAAFLSRESTIIFFKLL